MQILGTVQLIDNFFCHPQLEENTSYKFLAPTLQCSGSILELSIQGMKGVSVLDRVVPARRDCVHITGKLPPDGLKHEPTMEDVRWWWEGAATHDPSKLVARHAGGDGDTDRSIAHKKKPDQCAPEWGVLVHCSSRPCRCSSMSLRS
jgi:hypothetical protein